MFKKLLAVLLLAASLPAFSQAKPKQAADPWWKHAIIYEIYPRSFQDSNGDGMGDLNGITRRLDYLKDLGVDAIWITPFYPSPQIDYGYDISDYTAIDPDYGTMADFDRLIAEAKKRDIKVLLDFVMNHTSDQHAWFKESRSSKDNPKRDWYIWRDGKGADPATGKPGVPPNNWLSWFGGSAWTLDPKTNQYYYHYFYVEQPDLNWRNPQVKKAMFDVVRFWLKKGASGFRVDAVSRLYEDPAMRDEPLLPGKNAYGDPNIKRIYTDDLPEIHDALKELRAVVDEFPGDPVLVTEAAEPNVEELSRMYGKNLDEVQLPMDFQIADVNELSAPKFRKLLDEIENNPAGGWPEYFFGNHDQDRSWDRYGDGKHNDQIAKLMAALLLMPRATPQMYYGEEIGMRTTPPARVEDVHDPIGKKGWPKEKGRDGERTPMQWDTSNNAGFTTAAKSWLWIPDSAKSVNVEVEKRNPNSLLNWYKQLIALRRSNVAIRNGSYVTVNGDDPNVLSFLRQNGNETVLVALNMSGQPRTLNYKLKQKSAKVLLATPKAESPSVTLKETTIPAFGVMILELK